MVADKLTMTTFTVIILFTAVGFLPIFLYFCALVVGVMKVYRYFHT